MHISYTHAFTHAHTQHPCVNIPIQIHAHAHTHSHTYVHKYTHTHTHTHTHTYDYSALPVKLMPAKCGELVTMFPNVGPSIGTKFSTPENIQHSRL